MIQTAPIAITMGDASGIGPEIVAKTLAKGGERMVVFGSCVVMENIARRLGLDLTVRRIAGSEEARSEPRSIEVVEATQIIAPPPLGSVIAISGQASFDAVVAAVAAAEAGDRHRSDQQGSDGKRGHSRSRAHRNPRGVWWCEARCDDAGQRRHPHRPNGLLETDLDYVVICAAVQKRA